MANPVTPPSPAHRLPIGGPGNAAAKALAAGGLAVGFAGMVQIASAWNPPRFGSAYWLYRVAGGTLDGLSLVTLGFVAVAAYLIQRNATSLARIVALGGAALMLAAVVVFGVFLSSLDRVRAMAAASNDTQALKDAIVLTSVTALASIFVYAFGAWLAWRVPRETVISANTP